MVKFTYIYHTDITFFIYIQLFIGDFSQYRICVYVYPYTNKTIDHEPLPRITLMFQPEAQNVCR